MPVISLIIPTLNIGDKLEQCLASLEGQYDELIVVDDKNENLAVKINKGLEQANGDFIVVSNDDIILEKGTLADLCEEGKVVSPTVIGGLPKTFHAHMWCFPYQIYKKAVGTLPGYSDFGKPGYYEGFYRFYWDDSDYWMKLRATGAEIVKTDNVVIKHEHPGWTLGTFYENQGTMEFNRDLFIKRWGQSALKIVE